jgi:hypothetical protein
VRAIGHVGVTMPSRLLSLLAVLTCAAAVAVAATPAVATTWPVRTVATGGPAFAVDVAGLPDGTVGTLLERRVGAASRLELWVGTRHTLVATSAHGHSFDGRLTVDQAARWLVAYTVVSGGARGTRQAYVWTAARGVQRVRDTGGSGVALAVAPDGRAAVAFTQGPGAFVARGTTTGGFAAAQEVSGATSDEDSTFVSGVGIADDGTVTVGIAHLRAYAMARAAWDAPFGAPVTIPVPSRDETAFTVTSSGLAVAAVKQTIGAPSGPYTRSVSAITWPAGAATPTAPQLLSRDQAGPPAARSLGGRAFVVWRQARTTRTSPATLGTASFVDRPQVTPRVRFTIPGRGGAGGPLGTIMLAPSGTGVRPYFAVGDSIHSTHVDADARVSGTSVVAGPSEGRPYVAAAEAAGRPVVVWTRRLFDGNAGYRIRLARPAR